MVVANQTVKSQFHDQPEKLRALRWEALAILTGLRRTGMINDLMRHEIPIQVRLIPEVIQKRTEDISIEEIDITVPNKMASFGTYPERIITLTPEWQEVDAMAAFWMHYQTYDNPLFGASYVREGYVRIKLGDGSSEVRFQPRGIPREPAIEFRTRADIASEGLSETSDLVVKPRKGPKVVMTPTPEELEIVGSAPIIDTVNTPPVDDTPVMLAPTQAEVLSLAARTRRKE